MAHGTLKLGAVLLGVGGPGQHDTWLSPEIPGDASVDIRWYMRGLWDSYEDGAFPRDKQSGVFFDPSRQHPLNHKGEHFSVAEQITRLARENGFTLRQTVQHMLESRRSPFVGSPLTVANEIQRWFTAGALDGINVTVTEPSEFALFTDRVLPILRERGVVRGDYEATTLRGNLGLPVPENRWTAERRLVPLASADGRLP